MRIQIWIKNIWNKLHSQWVQHKNLSDIGYCIGIALLLWLMMYPEFSITAQNCRIVDENGQIVETDMTDRELAMAVLEAEDGEIVIKSRLWELVTKWSEENHNGESNN